MKGEQANLMRDVEVMLARIQVQRGRPYTNEELIAFIDRIIRPGNRKKKKH